MHFKVIGGDFPKRTSVGKFWGRVSLSWGWGKDKSLELNDQLKAVNVLTDEQVKLWGRKLMGATALSLLPGGILLGGLLAGNRKRLVVQCDLHDDRMLMVETDMDGYKALLGCVSKAPREPLGGPTAVS
jgi:hypothetical protein